MQIRAQSALQAASDAVTGSRKPKAIRLLMSDVKEETYLSVAIAMGHMKDAEGAAEKRTLTMASMSVLLGYNESEYTLLLLLLLLLLMLMLLPLLLLAVASRADRSSPVA